MAVRKSSSLPSNTAVDAADADANKTDKQKLGSRAEQLAEAYLIRHKLRVLARNYRCRFGEIDLVMQDGATLVFVEVRLRSSTTFGGAGASIGAAKQRRIIAAAQHYLAGLRETPACRFDAILVNEMNDAGVEWIKDAWGT